MMVTQGAECNPNADQLGQQFEAAVQFRFRCVSSLHWPLGEQPVTKHLIEADGEENYDGGG